jgi:hypothetical protein
VRERDPGLGADGDELAAGEEVVQGRRRDAGERREQQPRGGRERAARDPPEPGRDERQRREQHRVGEHVQAQHRARAEHASRPDLGLQREQPLPEPGDAEADERRVEHAQRAVGRLGEQQPERRREQRSAPGQPAARDPVEQRGGREVQNQLQAEGHEQRVAAERAQEAEQVGIERRGEEGRLADERPARDLARPVPVHARVVDRRAQERVELPLRRRAQPEQRPGEEQQREQHAALALWRVRGGAFGHGAKIEVRPARSNAPAG